MFRKFINNNIVSLFYNHIIFYPTPINISYLWGLGSLAGIMLILQILTGIFLAMHYVPNVTEAFNSVEHIMRDVNSGWLLRYMHANGASMFFIVVYLHMARGLFYRSYLWNKQLWNSGVAIFFLMMGTAFIGYVLPWGQMSFWGATVITNLVSAIPYLGKHIAEWLWGGYAVGNPTLNRFFSIHYLLPIILVGLMLLHLAFLHNKGSTNPTGNVSYDRIPFHPYFSIKDTFGLIVFLIFFFIFVIHFPNVLGHSDNYIEANPLVTPLHIVPEWYFLPFYAILRACPDKIGGVISMVSAILILIILPYVDSKSHLSPNYRFVAVALFTLFGLDFLLLGWLGGQPATEPFIVMSKISSIGYFSFFLALVPLNTIFENLVSNSREYNKKAIPKRNPW